MDKIEIYHYLKRQNIAYEITEHKAVFNMEEADAVDLPYPEWGAKNLFVRDDKKRNYYLITMKGNKRVDLKAFRRQRGLRALSFAAAEELFDIMKLIPGAVTPMERDSADAFLRNTSSSGSAKIATSVETIRQKPPESRNAVRMP